jgi:hypothetical protein
VLHPTRNHLGLWYAACFFKQRFERGGLDFMGRDWREICEEVLRTKDDKQLNALLEELLEALDARARNREKLRTTPTDS